MMNVKQALKNRSFFGHPMGLMPLMAVLVTLILLTLMLGAMVWGRLSLLQNGTQVILKTAPVDPRDLLRGYFVRLRYDISRISPDELETPLPAEEIKIGFKRHASIFVKLQPDADGFWTPRSLHRTIPSGATKAQSVFIRGRVQYGTCSRTPLVNYKCTYSIRYGIEKFFAEKKRAKKLEDFGRQQSPEIKELRKQIRTLLQKNRRSPQQPGQNTQQASDKRTAQLVAMRARLSKLIEKNRLEMAKRFAVIARIDAKSGEAAISGLQLDGKAIYEERLF